MISCQFCKIFKNTVFTEHSRWLLFAILNKPLDSQRQLCKWISKLATIYFILTFCWHFCLFLASTSFPFTSRGHCVWRNMTVLIFQMTTQLKCHVFFLGGSPSFWFSTLPSSWDHGPCECGDKTFWLDT